MVGYCGTCRLGLDIGNVALAVSTGMWDRQRFVDRIIEVDAAPPGKHASMMVHTGSDNTMSRSLRHGVYDLPQVQRQVGKLIRDVSRGKYPKLRARQLQDYEYLALVTSILRR